ncbi:choice-of-anchor D domain-containing protein [candidate division WOR-3 bacterium]|nr:choice-of-anchor D domain-containing protein [candidate division WOR-3 bacterium]
MYLKEQFFRRRIVILLAGLFLISSALSGSVTHIWPESGINEVTTSAHIFGSGFTGTPTVKLERTGSPELTATNVNVASSNYLTCDFDLDGAESGLYNVMVDTDTLRACFTIHIKVDTPVVWVTTDVGSASNGMTYVAVGDANNDGELEVYGANANYHIYQFKWNGTTWDATDVGSGGNSMSGVSIGDGNNDGELEVYGANQDQHIYQFKWNGTSWDKTDIGAGTDIMRGVGVGDGNNDGELEVYGACRNSHMYQFKWNGSTWDRTDMGSIGFNMFAAVVGDGNNDGELEVYGTNDNGHMYQFKWNGSTWDMTDMGNVGTSDMGKVAVGDGNNDGEFEVYGTNQDHHIYQFKWNSSTWDMTDVGAGENSMYGVYIGDGDNDGEPEVYGAGDQHIYQFKWNGTTWDTTDMGSGGNAMYGVAVGDGNNDGILEVYGANSDNHIYQFKSTPCFDIALSDSSYDFGDVLVGDSLDWTFRIYSIGVDTLTVDSIMNNLSVYQTVSPSFPQSIAPDDSMDVTVRFKPDLVNIYEDTLSIFNNDPGDAIVYVCLSGTGNLPALTVTHIWPESGINEDTTSAHIFGSGFSGTPTVKLEKSGLPEITGINVNVASSNYLTCDFDLAGADSGLYSLIVETDTLRACFTVNSRVISPFVWDKTDMGSGGSYMVGVAVGDGNNDGELEVYSSNYDYHIYQFKWNGISWDKTDMGSGGDQMFEVAVGDGNNDGKLEVYSANCDYHIYQFKWNGTTWDKTDMGSGGDHMFGVAIGDGNNDGDFEVYGTNADYHIYQFKWNGTTWDKTDMGSGGYRMHRVAVGDGNNDGLLEVYGANLDYHIYQFKWNGTTWDKTDMGSGGNYMAGVAVGDGNNDGELEVYGSNYDYHIYQFKWNGISWDKTDMGSGGAQMYGIAVGDGNNDGKLEVYGANLDYHIYQFKWNGTTWDTTDMGSGADAMYGAAVGDGNNDGRLDVYGANRDYHIYKFRSTMYQNIVLSDTTHNFGDIQQGDSAQWEYLYTKNTGELVLHIDSIVSSDAVFSVLNTLPDSVSPGDSTGFTIQFKPLVEEVYQGTLSVYSDDPDDSLLFVYLEGTGTTGIEESSETPQVFGLSIDTPAKGKAVFRFGVPEKCEVRLEIYDVTGRLISVPLSGEYSEGYHNISFSPKTKGIYFYRLNSRYGNRTGKIVIF